MEVLLDTGVWFRRYHGLPLRRDLLRLLDDEATAFYLCPLSVTEITFKWQRGRLPGLPDPATWVPHSLEHFLIAPVTAQSALQAGLWDWDHGDLVDRTLAAIAKETGIPLIHTDRVLKGLLGFPQRYFRGKADASP